MQELNYPVDKNIEALGEIFKKNSHTLYIVGGAIRDYILNKKTSDIDFATSATPEEMLRIFPHSIKTGIKHGTLTIPFRRNHYEITTFRIDGEYKDSRHPENITFTNELREDLKRRDFTINAMAADCKNGAIIDEFSGIDDINKRIVRTVGNPKKRFEEDALRMLRAIRFATVLNFNIEEETFNAIIEQSGNINKISKERIQSEFFKIILSPFAERGVLLLQKSALLDKIFPSLEKCFHFKPAGGRKKRAKDQLLSTHILNVFRYVVLNNASISLRLAALFHDISKPETYALNNGVISFHLHEIKGSEKTRKILKELKCSNAIIDKTCTLIKYHMVNYTPAWSDKAIRKLILNIGKDNLNDFLLLYQADLSDMSDEIILRNANEFLMRLEKINNDDTALTIKDLKINGNDLKNLGYNGKEIGKILDYLHEAVLDDPLSNTNKNLINLAKAYKENTEQY